MDKELLKFESQEEKPNVMQNPLPAHGNNGAGPSSNAISLPERGFDPSQLITRPGTRVRVRFEEALPEVNMISFGRQKSVKLKTSSDADYLADPSMIKKEVETEEEYNTVTDDTPNGESSSEDPLQQLDWLGTATVTPLSLH